MTDDGRVAVKFSGGEVGEADRDLLETGAGEVAVALPGGRSVLAPVEAFERIDEATYGLAVEVGETADLPVVVPVVAEEAVVAKRAVETGRVRVRKRTRERVETVDVPLFREEVEVRRVPSGRLVDAGGAEVRQEGETTIVPVVEEVLVVEKRLRVREELHITLRRTEARRPEAVTLRSEVVEVESVPAEGGPA